MVFNNPNYVSTPPDDDIIMEFLLPKNGGDVYPLQALLSSYSNVSFGSATPVKLKDLSGEYTQPYDKYTIGGATAMDESLITDVMSIIKGFFSDPVNACPDVMYLDGRKVMRDSNYYSNPDKQTYLDYVFGLENGGQSLYDISNNIAPGVLQGTTGAGLSPFTSAALVSYQSPWCSNVKEDLYYGPNPTLANPGWDTLNKIINCVKAATPLGLGTGKLFLTETDNIKNIASSATLGSASSLKAIKMSNGWSWFRLFNNNSKLYNVYLIPPANMLDTFSYYSVAPGAVPQPVAGTDNLYRFKILMKRQTTGMTDPHYVTCYGYTDFPLGSGNVLKNVVLSDGVGNASCLDTFPCERNTMVAAILQGKAMYASYMDSIKNYHYARMKSWFPENTVDTLDFSTWKQQYQYTLYNYDLAGNLTSTVPPEGVKPFSDADAAGIDNMRNTNFSGAGSYPPFLNLGNTSGGKKSEYYYNSFNQLTKQSTPDGGITTFYYDNAGRLVFSQNAKQAPYHKYSYTLYDKQGRICETGATVFSGISEYNVFNSNTLGMAGIAVMVRGMPREDVVATFYDEALLALNTYTNEGLNAQENLRKRVSSILYIPQLAVNNSAESFYSYATHFSYDALGNVKTLVQDNPYMNYLGQRFKRVDYDYDLLSGKVNMVSYNRGKADQFYQKYDYDADNRITDVQTSNDALIWDKDAHYDYYKHGPLAQVEIGNLKVQSLQYAYTIQGWLKAINGDVLDSIADMGEDGKNGGFFPRDVMAHALDYFPGDYKPIGARQVENSDSAHIFYKGLHNGNIARQITGIQSLDNLQRTYTYDQLNRIRQTLYDKVDNLTHAVTDMAGAFANSYQYDKDGNIKMLTRRDGNGTLIDTFTYKYLSATQNNKLGYVTDNAAATGGTDLQDQPVNNYTYDPIGNLKSDLQGNIQGITWNLYGKATDLSMNTNNKRIHFDYDGMGNRTRKDVTVLQTSGGVTNGMRSSDLYVRDASGNILAVYKGKTKITGGFNIGWVNDHITSFHGSWHTPTGYGLSPFLAAEFGNNGQFTMPLLDYAQVANLSWCEEQSTSLSLSHYLMLSDGIYSQALHSDVGAYFGNLRDHDDGQTITQAFIAEINRNFMPLLGSLVTPGDDTAHAHADEDVALRVFPHLFKEAPGMTDLIADALGIKLNYNSDDDANAFYAYIGKYGNRGFLDIFVSPAILNQEEAERFIEKTIQDPDIITSDWLGRQADASRNIGDVLMASGDRTGLSSFFETWLPDYDANWLVDHTNLNERLNIVMQNDMSTFLDNYLATIGIEAVNTSLESIAQMSVSNYVQSVWSGVMHGSLNPSYTPPNVNTPDSSNIANDTIYLAEHHLYGSSRLGIKTYDPAQYRVVFKGGTGPGFPNIILENTLGALTPWYSAGFTTWIKKDKSTIYSGNTFNLATDSFREIRTLGAKQYELCDHLGNVLATALDKKTGFGDSLSTSTGLHYNNGYYANLSSITDYFPFGMQMPDRTRQSPLSLDYQMGYNGQSKTDEIYGDGNLNTAMFWEYDTRIARRWNLDPKSQIFISDYAAFGNNPIAFSDILGDVFKISNGSHSAQEKEDVKDMTRGKTKSGKEVDGSDYVKFDNRGIVSLDFGSKTPSEVDKLLKENIGLALINDMINAKENGKDLWFLYTANSNQDWADPNDKTKIAEKAPYIYASSGQIAPETPRSASRTHKFINGGALIGKGGGIQNNDEEIKPLEGVAGMVNVPYQLTFYSRNAPQFKLRRASLVYHELKENWFRTMLHMPYAIPTLLASPDAHPFGYYQGHVGAHNSSVISEGNFFGNMTPGSYSQRPTLPIYLKL